MNTQQRLQKAQQLLKDNHIDAFLVSNFYNILYLSGIKTLSPEEREAYLLITSKAVYFFTDGRYVSEQLLDQLKKNNIVFKQIEPTKRLTVHLQERVNKEHIVKLGFEKADLKYIEYQILTEKLSCTLVPIDGGVAGQRVIKEREEIETIEKACALTDQCFKELIPLIRVGQSEKELAWKIEVWIREHELELAFDPIVAVDINSAVPHYDTKRGAGTVGHSSIILFDFGLQYNDYISDISRMVFVGKPSNEVANRYETLRRCQEKTIEYIKPAMLLKDVDAYCRSWLVNDTIPLFSHSTGHGVGLEVHELPTVSPSSKDTALQDGIFTIEPGIYIPGRYGMRVEDTVHMTSRKAQSLTRFPKDLLVI